MRIKRQIIMFTNATNFKKEEEIGNLFKQQSVFIYVKYICLRKLGFISLVHIVAQF